MYYSKRILFFLFSFCSSLLVAVEIQSLPVHRIEAEKVRSEDKKILLEGSVVAVLDMGSVHCGKAIILLDEANKQNKKGIVSHFIEFEQHVRLDFSDGSVLSADRGRIDCVKREGVFWGSDTEKVVYETAAKDKEAGEAAHWRASSNSLRGELVQTESGWKLDNLNAEGAVSMEYRP